MLYCFPPPSPSFRGCFWNSHSWWTNSRWARHGSPSLEKLWKRVWKWDIPQYIPNTSHLFLLGKTTMDNSISRHPSWEFQILRPQNLSMSMSPTTDSPGSGMAMWFPLDPKIWTNGSGQNSAIGCALPQMQTSHSQRCPRLDLKAGDQ